MAILFHESTKTFHLYNEQISYIFTVLKNDHLGQLYFGKRLRDRADFSHLLEFTPRPMAACTFEGDLSFSLEHIRQEYPIFGTGDIRYPAFSMERPNGSRIYDFTYQSHQITSGKPRLEGLPATYTESADEADTITITLYDQVTDVQLLLTYTIFRDVSAIARSVRFICGKESAKLLQALSLCLDLPDDNYELLELIGTWSRERQVKFRPLESGVTSIHSMRGCSSSVYNPFIALKRPETTEGHGEVYGFSFVYSGNFLAQAEVDTFHTTRVLMGIHPQNFSVALQPGECFQTPECIMVYSEDGLNGMSQQYHTLYRTRLARGYWRDRPRPILINNWEATYFNFNEEKILEIAEKAKALSIELFVLDDGWFGKRNNDTTSLGDWFSNLEKLPSGVEGLAKKITDMGLKFGLWFEPEMVNKDSEMYRTHPDWVLGDPERNHCHGRNQYILDFSRKEVVDNLYDQMCKVLDCGHISYIKWDMNRSMSEVYAIGCPPEKQGTVMHNYILGVYDLYERLRTRYPELLFESCSSGGARFDPGLLYYAPQAWTSDNTDAAERLKIQYGTSMVYPISSIGAHVSAVPNHQTGRISPIETRANTAYFGTFGYELNVNTLTEEDQQKIKAQVAFMKENRALFQFGTFYRLQSPFTHEAAAWMVVSEDQKTALVGYYKPHAPANEPYERIRLMGLDPNLCYRVSLNDTLCGGDELMQYGLITSEHAVKSPDLNTVLGGDYRSRLYRLTAVE